MISAKGSSEEVAVVEKAPKQEGRSISMVCGRKEILKEENNMPKIKTKSSCKSVFSTTGTGKLKRNKAWQEPYLKTKKTTKRREILRKAAMTDAQMLENMKKVLPYANQIG